jgi:hypothetical protein
VWSERDALLTFEDPGPALAYAVLRGDELGQSMIAALVERHAVEVGIELPEASAQSERTRVGIRVLKQLMLRSGLDPKSTIGEQTLDELVAVTWALGAVSYGA